MKCQPNISGVFHEKRAANITTLGAIKLCTPINQSLQKGRDTNIERIERRDHDDIVAKLKC